tara:strand:+ start:282 stop:485 length:204 start_codon:yes stop_codon:yes gene_type:complete
MELAMSMVENQTIQGAFRVPEEMAALPENLLIKAHMYALAYLLAMHPIYKLKFTECPRTIAARSDIT